MKTDEQIRNEVNALRRNLAASCGEGTLELVPVVARNMITSKALEAIDTALSSYTAGDLAVFLVLWAVEQKKENAGKL